MYLIVSIPDLCTLTYIKSLFCNELLSEYPHKEFRGFCRQSTVTFVHFRKVNVLIFQCIKVFFNF